ncbi:MAG: 50S ribosomal protein L4 [archaeon]
MQSKTNVYAIDGKVLKQVNVPNVFNEKYDDKLIRRAVIAIHTANLQPQGVKPYAGRDFSVEYEGMRDMPTQERTINIERARLPRMKNRRHLIEGRVISVPRAVGGPKAHPPQVGKILIERINDKERKKAVKSAIASTAKKELILARHKISDKIELPLVIENTFENLDKTKKVVDVLKKLNVYSDVENAKDKKHLRAGKGKLRGKKYKHKISLLIVTGKKSNVYKAARNLEGVDICTVDSLNAELLAPGTHAGRLVLWSEDAFMKLGELYG